MRRYDEDVNPPITVVEITLASYFFISFLREMTQLLIAIGLTTFVQGFTDYITGKDVRACVRECAQGSVFVWGLSLLDTRPWMMR